VAIGVLARVPSDRMIEFQESFQHWLTSPVVGLRAWYSTKPSPSRSPYSSIHRTAARAAGSSSRTVSASPVHRSYSSSTTRNSGVESAAP
jgi:hypothetical protein